MEIEQALPTVALRTPDVAAARGIYTPHELSQACNIPWRTAQEYLNDVPIRVTRDTLARICQGLQCHITDLFYIYTGEYAPPPIKLGTQPIYNVSFRLRVKERAVAQNLRSAGHLATVAGLCRGPAIELWRDRTGKFDRKRTLPRLYVALRCTSITDLIEMRVDTSSESSRRQQSLVAA
ncbi:MAG: XRE family transcriptional regulator [Candidatus Viridilinea halotolerans]|uniref:XRE family transcriptional regulator n=1 Tax=Candidatus Viridilinea halotolerans TaxID=2491704 RepID=A0A426U2Y3_9CHLR|nr:MAG: XRE family transcriptional regulator [Candidatus Viridilinea halotolerans]